MKLAVLIDRDYPSDHSFIEGFYQNALPKKIEQVFIFAWSKTSKQIKVDNNKIFIISKYSRFKLLRGAKVYLYTFFNLLKYCKNLDGVITRNKINLFLATRLYCFFNRKCRHYHQISNLHAETIQDGYSTSLLSRIKVRSELVFRFLFLHKANLIMAVSPWMSDYLLMKYPKIKRMIVLPLGVNVKDFTFMKPFSERDIDAIYVGTFNRLRKIDELIHSFNELRSLRNFNIYLVSSESSDHFMFKKINTLIKQLNLNDSVHLLPRMPRKELIEYLNRSKIGLSLIPSSGFLKQISPTKLMEYMASGCAVIASKGIPEQDYLLKESCSGKLIDFERTMISKTINDVLKDEQILVKSSAMARDFILKNRDYDLIVETFIKTLEELD